MPELLIELLSEEIPARMQARAADDLKRLVTDGLKAAGLAWTRAESYATPRRLALVVDGLPAHTPDRTDEQKGPRVDAPPQAIDGFLRKLGAGRTLSDCEQRDDGKSKFWVFVNRIAGQETADLLGRLVFDAAIAVDWPKSMKWASHRLRWVRPLHSIVAVFDGSPLRGAVGLGHGAQAPRYVDIVPPSGPGAAEGHVAYGSKTVGHRFLSRGTIEAHDFAQYRDALLAAHVMLDPARRRAKILAEAIALAVREGLRVRDDPGLLDEVTGLVEWPVALAGSIEPAFMALPPEVLTTSMRTHQRYFTLLKPDGTTAPRFVVVANMPAPEGSAIRAHIVAGNERVLRARLSDAKFFWEQDRKATLESRLPALGQRLFYAKLGTMADKAARLEALAADLAEFVPGCTTAKARRAGKLAKADLSTGMVGEFPELQGIMGRYYALADGEEPDVADAIRDHYKPLGPSDAVPTAPVSVAIALADKLDTLVGFFAIGEKPTGSKDPFALRRAALGAIRLIVESRARLPLAQVFAKANQLYRNHQSAGWSAPPPATELIAFFADRLKVALREQGVRHDLIDAVFALGGEDDLVRLLARVEALRIFLKDENGANLLAAFRRAANIVEIEQKKDKTNYEGDVDEAAFRAPEELALNLRLASVDKEVVRLLADEEFIAAMVVLASLRPHVDAFFERVTVNDPDPALRVNRLRLLSRIRATLGRVADFSRIEG